MLGVGRTEQPRDGKRGSEEERRLRGGLGGMWREQRYNGARMGQKEEERV